MKKFSMRNGQPAFAGINQSKAQPGSKLCTWLFVLLGALLFANPSVAQSEDESGVTDALPGQVFGETRPLDSSGRVQTSLIPSWGTAEVAPGSEHFVAVVFDHQDKWHVHTNDPQVPKEMGSFFAIATQIKPAIPDDVPVTVLLDETHWPKPKTIEVSFGKEPALYDVFEGYAVAYIPIQIAEDAEAGTHDMTFSLQYQACDDKNCLRPVMGQKLTLALSISPDADDQAVLSQAAFRDLVEPFEKEQDAEAETENGNESTTQDEQESDETGVASADTGSMWQMPQSFVSTLLLAFVGGVVLNLMPCVLPVIPIKILGLVQAAPEPGKRISLGLMMCLGVLSFWVVLGVIIASLAGSRAISMLFGFWWFNMSLGLLIAILAIGMCGLFSIGLPKWVYKFSPKHDSYLGSFGFGIMTAVLATPCTGPFLGGAAATVLGTGPVAAFAVFASIGLGMAIPYFLLSAMPGLVEKLPRTGPASELIKQVLGLLMLAAAGFFIGVGVNALIHDGTKSVYQWYWWLSGGIVTIAAIWMLIRTIQITPRMIRRLGYGSVAVLLGLGSIATAYEATRPSNIQWVYYTPETFEQTLAQGNPIMLEFTADWCFNCKALERAVLETKSVVGALDKHDVVPMKVDLTGDFADGWAKLNEVDRLAIPLLVVFDPDGNEVFKQETYTVSQVVGALESSVLER